MTRCRGSSVNELIVTDRLLSSLDSETRNYVKLKQMDDWQKPREIAELCDNWFTSKGRTFSELYDRPIKSFRNYDEPGSMNHEKYAPPHIRNNVLSRERKTNDICRLCG